MKLNVDSLVVEVTRKCNMSCNHCLRGDIENMDLTPKHLDHLFEKINYVSTITLTGGEPSLNVDGILKVLSYARCHDVEIGNFYIATNAHEKNKPFIMACLDWWLYCEENDASCVNWSNDKFHDINPVQSQLLAGLSFAEAKYSGKYEPGIILEGRGADLTGTITNSPAGFEVWENDGDETANISEQELYLNCEGMIIAGCDWSYESQRDEDVQVCKVQDLSLEAIKKYNERF